MLTKRFPNLRLLAFFALIFALTGFVSSARAQNEAQVSSWMNVDIIADFHGANEITYLVAEPEVKRLDTLGGEILFRLTPRSHPNCTQEFLVGWNFEKDVRVLTEGETFNVQVFNHPGGILDCYWEAKGWAYDGGYLMIEFPTGSRLPYNEAYRKYGEGESQYLFTYEAPTGYVHPSDSRYPAKKGSAVATMLVIDAPYRETLGSMNAQHGLFTFTISKGGVFTYQVNYLYDAYDARLQAPIDPLGWQWQVYESGWYGTWTRRGNTNIFDAQWGDGQITAELTISSQGNQVSIARRNSSDGNDCDYTGTLAQDGVIVTGSYRCTLQPEPLNWSGFIHR